MSETLIGLHVFTIHARYRRSEKNIQLSQSSEGAALASYCEDFIKKYSEEADGKQTDTRSWYLEPNTETPMAHHGIVRYGTTGFSEEIRDRKTKSIQYNRKPTDIGTIPLYYRLWIPKQGEYGLLALQTFGSRSCVERFKQAFYKGFRSRHPTIVLDFKPVMPMHVAKFRDGPVKTFSLTKRDYSSDKADNQIGTQGSFIDLDVTFKAKPRGSLGPLSSFSEKIKGMGRSKILEYNNTHFDEATAEILVGNKKRKITLVGVSKNSGKFDLTDDLQKISGHPTFESIAKECEDIFKSIVSV